MTETHTFIEITAPHHSEELNNQTSVMRMACNYCNGTGEILHIDKQDEREFLPCPCCKGSRFVDAIITVSFEPSRFVLIKSKIGGDKKQNQNTNTVCPGCGRSHPLVAEFGYCGKCAEQIYGQH